MSLNQLKLIVFPVAGIGKDSFQEKPLALLEN
jgi:hypothetical protein